MKDNQKYSKIAKQYLEEISQKDNINYAMVCYGNLGDMEELFDRFGGNRDNGRILGEGQIYRFQYVMNKLDKESKEFNAIFKKGYICYNGIINRPTRCFKLENKGEIN